MTFFFISFLLMQLSSEPTLLRLLLSTPYAQRPPQEPLVSRIQSQLRPSAIAADVVAALAAAAAVALMRPGSSGTPPRIEQQLQLRRPRPCCRGGECGKWSWKLRPPRRPELLQLRLETTWSPVRRKKRMEPVRMELAREREEHEYRQMNSPNFQRMFNRKEASAAIFTPNLTS